MPQSYTQIYIHITCHTKHNYPFIKDDISDELYHYIGGILKNLNSVPIQINGVQDHIHLLCTLPKTMSLSKLAEEFKKSSSKWMKREEQMTYFQTYNNCLISHSSYLFLFHFITQITIFYY